MVRLPLNLNTTHRPNRRPPQNDGGHPRSSHFTLEGGGLINWKSLHMLNPFGFQILHPLKSWGKCPIYTLYSGYLLDISIPF